SGKASETPARALAFCGIGDPALFRQDLEAAGVGIARFRAFRDHRPYTPEDWETLLAEGRQLGVPLVTTDKDLSRLQATIGANLTDTSLPVFEIEAVVWDEAPLLDALLRALASRGPAAPR